MKILVQNDVFIRSQVVPNALADIWCIHGFAESGLSFKEIFTSSLAQRFNIFVPDLPGFGVTPPVSTHASIADSVRISSELISHLSFERPLILIGHSLGGLIATRLASKLAPFVQFYGNIEGNLTQADTFYSGLSTKYESSTEFYSFFTQEMFSKMGADEALHRYYASVRFADPATLLSWGKSCFEVTGKTKGGDEFAALHCAKKYYWGDKSTPKVTQAFIHENKIPHHCFRGSGHWPMVDQPTFYEVLGSDISEQTSMP